MKLVDYLETFIHESDGSCSATYHAGDENEFSEILEARDIYPNGYAWEFFFMKLLQKAQPDLLNHSGFDSEAEYFVIFFEEKTRLDEFVDVVGKALPDLKAFEAFVATLDHKEYEAYDMGE